MAHERFRLSTLALSVFVASASVLAMQPVRAVPADAAEAGAASDAARSPRHDWRPRQVASFDRKAFAAMLGADPFGAQVLALAGAPRCGVDYHRFAYATTGARSEPTNASGVIMTPTGGRGCTGPRPVLLYTHGTAVNKGYNLAQVTDTSNEAWQEGAMIAAFYAAQGYIVVAPNYAGYDSSALGYHPYLNARQQSRDVMDALETARAALRFGLRTQVVENGKLFITGYSQGGHVAMATHRAMQARGMHVTASAPMSGPYAMLAFGDATAIYSPGLGGTIYYPMIINSYQRAYGDIYQSLGDIYTPSYAAGIDQLIPGSYTFETLITSGKLPQLALYDSRTPGQGGAPSSGSAALDALLAAPDAAAHPLAALAFGSPSLFTNAFRIRFAQDSLATPDGAVPQPTNLLPPVQDPAMPLRRALKQNDLRGWTPKAPVMLCGGMNDPEVFYGVNTLTMKQLWSGKLASGRVQVVDVDPSSDGDQALAGQIVTLVGGIAARVAASEPGVSASQLGDDVRQAIVAAPAFAAYFAADGQPNAPQGVMAQAIAGTAGKAAEAVAAAAAGQGGTGQVSPAAVASAVGSAVIASYHYPNTQLACETAARAYFARF